MEISVERDENMGLGVYPGCSATSMVLSPTQCPVSLTTWLPLPTCSAFRVSSIKICCSFSLTKLMQNCSKPFFCGEKKRVLPSVG